MNTSSQADEYDVIVVGSGAAGLSAALAARLGGASVIVLEKSTLLGGTTAMSGGNVWVPCHHRMSEVGASDSREDALAYIRAASPEGWHNVEEPLWVAFVDHAPAMLKSLERYTPLRFTTNREPDPYAELPGGKRFGRNVSAQPLAVGLLGPWQGRLREPSRLLRFRLRYEEAVDTHFYVNPKKWMPRFLPRLLWRWLRGLRTMGNALVIGLLRGALDHGCVIRTDTRVTALSETAGRVSGVEAEIDGRPTTFKARRGVVLASGGFEWNREMMSRYLPGPVEWTGSPSSITGDGQLMAQRIGARLDRMDQALVGGTVPFVYEGRLQGSTAADYLLPHSMLVNRHARRFVNEKQMNIGLACLQRDPETGQSLNLPAWRVYDSQFARKYPHALPSRKLDGVFYTDPTLDGLARQIEVDPHTLVQTAKRMSEFARAGIDDDFGRGESIWDRQHIVDSRHGPNPTLGSIEVPPFYAMPFKASFFTTKGGVRTNDKGQALHTDGSIIPGLYAAGSVMANPFGTKAMGAGTTLGPCLTWGYICGSEVVHEKQTTT